MDTNEYITPKAAITVLFIWQNYSHILIETILHYYSDALKTVPMIILGYDHIMINQQLNTIFQHNQSLKCVCKYELIHVSSHNIIL